MARTAARLEEGGGGAVIAGDAGAGEEADEGGVGRRRSRTALLCFATNSMLGTVKGCVCVCRGGGVSMCAM